MTGGSSIAPSTFAYDTPRPRPNDSHGQVSWLPDRRFPAAFPSQGPVACGGIAPRSQLRGQRRVCTSFPLRACVNRPTRDSPRRLTRVFAMHKRRSSLSKYLLSMARDRRPAAGCPARAPVRMARVRYIAAAQNRTEREPEDTSSEGSAARPARALAACAAPRGAPAPAPQDRGPRRVAGSRDRPADLCSAG